MKIALLLIFGTTLFLFSCKKNAGEGGKASIQGFVWLKEYNGNFNSLELERAGFDEYVYIQYGDDINYSDRIRTNFEGKFEFKYLRPGKYKVYCYSKDPNDKDNVSPTEMMSVIQDIEITGKKQIVELDTLTIYN